MLVLTRKQAESIWIGPDIELTVLAIGRSRVRLGISAPAQYLVRREELVATSEQERDLTQVEHEGESGEECFEPGVSKLR